MRKLVEVVNRTAEVLTLGLLAAVVIIVFLQIVFRSIFLQPLSWSEELARYLFVWLIFMGASTIVRVGGHPGMDIVVRGLPFPIRRLVDMAMHLLFCLTLIAIAITGFMLVGANMAQPSPAMEMPMGIPYAAIPLAALIMLLNVVFFVFFPQERGDK